jgi:hydroxymethylpyrimidine pyrophosphatase-like HAD family hydrolase
MIRAVVLDVDGVIVGDREGFNFPYPHREVIESLRKVHESGIFVSLCTGKMAYAIEKIVRDAHLDNIHIADGGAIGVNPIEKKAYFQYAIDKLKVLSLANFYISYNIYIEFYTSSEYFVLKRQVNEFTARHTKVLQKEPVLLDELDSLLEKGDVIRMVLNAKNEAQRDFIIQTFAEKFGRDFDIGWTMNLYLVPWHLGIVTVKGISKGKGVEDISKYLNVPLENILGIGDTMHDWEFIKICGFGATMANASEKLKELVLQKGDLGYVGRDVNENGVIDVLKHFELL